MPETAVAVRELTLGEAVREALAEEMRRDPRVFIMGEDVAEAGTAFKVLGGLVQEFGTDRVLDTPISEAAIVGAACGAGLMGMKPVAEFQFIDFISCAFNQITNLLAKAHYRWNAPAPIVLRGPCGGGVHGGPFH